MTNLSFLEILSEYRVLFLVTFLFILFAVFVVVLVQLIKKFKEYMEDKQKELTKEEALQLDYETIEAEEKSGIIRRVIAPDGINPGPDDHLVIYDAVNKVYARSLTISKMSRRVNFANTFAPLFDYPECTSTVFVEPIDEQTMGHTLDRRLIVLEAEYITASGDSNRKRKLQSMYSEANDWAAEVETGKNKFFRVGFVFTLYSDTLDGLTKESDAFRNLARNKGLDVTTCVCVQSEAYIANAPMNRYVGGKAPVNATDGVFYHYMDKYSIATVYNYTSATFSHRDGVPLGRDRETRKPVIYNPYNPTFNGYTHCVVGKTGTGKSASLKMLTYRCSIFGYRFASLDVQPRQGTGDGEYAGICELLGGLNFELKSDSNNCLNIFEVMETKKFIKTGIGKGYEQRDLDLRSAIAQSVNLIKIMISENGSNENFRENVMIDSVIRNGVEDIFASAGIIDGDPSSLYVVDPSTGISKEKPLPTLSDFYKNLVCAQLVETDPEEKSARKIVLKAMEKNIREVCYIEETGMFFESHEYEALPVNEQGKKIYENPQTGAYETVIRVRGTRPYFDGQSTLRYSTDIPWVNIDCSQLDEASKQVAMSVGMNYINERIIKGNSDSRDGEINKVLCIFDEAHMIFKIDPARALLAEIVRTARKRFVSLFICSQTLREFDEYEETRAIRVNAAALFIYKQDYSDRQYLIDTLGLTPSQVDGILKQGGDLDRVASSEDAGELEKEAAKHRGEMTIVINRTAIPIKVDYRKRTERYAVETTASEIIQDIKKAGGQATA